MAVADRTLMLKLIADVNQPAQQLKGVSGALKRAGSAAKAWGRAFTGALVIGGVERLVGSLDDAFKDFKEGEDAARRLGQTWRTLGRDTDQLSGILEGLGDTALDLGFDDAEVITAFNTFLAKSGSVKDSTQGVQAAMNLARAKGISFARAVKIVTGQLGDLDPALQRNKRQARIWARNHPLEVTLGKITDLWGTFVGEFSKGRINRAFAALGGIGAAINDLLFGQIGKGGERTGGLVDRFVDIGRKLVPALILGLGALGEQLLNAWNTAVAGVDWGTAIGNAVGGAVELLLDNQNIVANLAIVAAALAAGLFVADVFAAAASAMFAAPKLLFNAALRAAVFALGAALAGTMRVAMFLGETAIDLAAGALRLMLASIPVGTGSAVFSAAFAVGGAIQAAIAAGVSIGLFALLSAILQDTLNSLLPGGTRLRFNPETGQMERFAKGGIVTRPTVGLLGEAGPEAVIPLSEMGSSGGWGDVTVNVYAGVGNPVEIGREVDRVLRAYRVRAGKPV